MHKLFEISWSTFYKHLSLSLLGAILLGACTDYPASITDQQPVIVKQRAEWRTLLKWDNACERAYQSTNVTDEAGVETYVFDDTDKLVRVLCAVGSYEPSFLLYRIKDQQPALLRLETYIASDEDYLQRTLQTELWGEIFVNPKTRTLVIVNVARQTKDCGTWAQYGLKAYSVDLQALYSKLPCPLDIASPVSPDAANPPTDWQRLKDH
jgi:hypothetical protein